MAPPNNRFYSGGELELRGFDVRGATPYGYVPTRVNFQLTNPDGSCVPRDPTNPKTTSAFRYRCRFTALPPSAATPIHRQCGIPHSRRRALDFRFFDDFGIDSATNHSQLKQSPEGFASLTAPLYGCPVYNNGSCQGGIPGSQVGFKQNIRPVSGTNFVPRMSVGAELSVLMPIINAPFRLYYAYNPLRLYERPYCNDVILGQKQQSCSAELITRDMFPPGGAGDYTYAEAIQSYGSRNVFREPRKTFRLTISTTF